MSPLVPRSCRFALAWLLALAPAAVLAKRAAAAEVPPVVDHGVKYVFPHFSTEGGEAQAGGVVEARDEKSGALLWRVRVYSTRVDPKLERDVQDVFLTSARLEGGKLVVTNEKGETYEVDLATHAVRKR